MVFFNFFKVSSFFGPNTPSGPGPGWPGTRVPPTTQGTDHTVAIGLAGSIAKLLGVGTRVEAARLLHYAGTFMDA